MKRDIKSILEKRHAPKKTITLTQYDLKTYKSIKELAVKEDTNISSIVQNLLSDLLRALDGSPNTTLDVFDDFNRDVTIPSIYDGVETWQKYVQNLNTEEQRQLHKQIVMVDKIWMKVIRSRR